MGINATHMGGPNTAAATLQALRVNPKRAINHDTPTATGTTSMNPRAAPADVEQNGVADILSRSPGFSGKLQGA